MDLTPQLFRDVQFRERKGGYDRDDVDEFLARVGTAVAQLQDRVRDMHRRTEAAEARARELEAASREQGDADETLRRTLVLAQRTADAAVQEAEQQAEQIVEEARRQASAERAEAEASLRRDLGTRRERLDAEIAELAEQRRGLAAQLSTLSQHVDAERERLRAELFRAQVIFDDAERFSVAAPDGIDLTEAVTPLSPQGEEDAALAVDEPSVAREAEPLPDEVIELEASASGLFDQSPTAAEPAASESGEMDLELDLGGPPTLAQPAVMPGPAVGNSHLEELRRAVSDEVFEEEDDAAMAAFFDQDSDEQGRRFGRRR